MLVPTMQSRALALALAFLLLLTQQLGALHGLSHGMAAHPARATADASPAAAAVAALPFGLAAAGAPTDAISPAAAALSSAAVSPSAAVLAPAAVLPPAAVRPPAAQGNGGPGDGSPADTGCQVCLICLTLAALGLALLPGLLRGWRGCGQLPVPTAGRQPTRPAPAAAPYCARAPPLALS